MEWLKCTRYVCVTETMVLTDEQRKRMEENRMRALEIRKRKQMERGKSESSSYEEVERSNVFHEGGFFSATKTGLGSKKLNPSSDVGLKTPQECNSDKKIKSNGKTTNQTGATKISDAGESDEESLEDFEYDASPYISQTEAQRTYCVPMGTLAVCSFIEKDNPHHRGFSKMKLYLRSEVRSRARKRFGGKAQLIREREKRSKKRFEKDLVDVKGVFR
ncbi:hypothetical protein ACHAXS_005755 [Conticribra weissflogii]